MFIFPGLLFSTERCSMDKSNPSIAIGNNLNTDLFKIICFIIEVNINLYLLIYLNEHILEYDVISHLLRTGFCRSGY